MNLTLSEMRDLQREVDQHIPALINSLTDEDKTSTLSVVLKFKRAKDTETGIIMTYSVLPTYPRKSKQIFCRQDLCGNLVVDKEDINSNLLLPFDQLETDKAENDNHKS